MPSSGKLGAVSDYEHLNSHHFLKNNKRVFQGDDSAESDFLPLKPSQPRLVVESGQFSEKGVQDKDCNTNNAGAGVVRVQKSIGLTQMLNDFGHLQSLKKIPVPTAWSPSLKHAPNPALLVTPEKTIGQLKSKGNTGKDDMSELQSSSLVPVPVAWSPGMVLKPNPALMVTPDKPTGNKACFVKRGSSKVPNEGQDITTFRTTDKPTVRFDLPQASSGEDTLNTSHEIFANDTSSKSPITLKGRELLEDGDCGELSSPPWKAFSPQKTYDPNAYSDDSFLDDSIQNTKHHSQNLNTAQKTLDTKGSTSDCLADKLEELLMSSASTTQPLGTFSNISTQPLSDKTQAGHRTNISEQEKADLSPSRKIMSAASIPRHPKKKRTAKINQQASRPLAGPDFIKAPPTAYEPKSLKLNQPQVLREWDSDPEKNNYSFPFDSEGASGGDLVSEHTFARPEYNSTLWVRSELDELCNSEIDVEKAVASALTKSESKRTELNEKASMFTNRMSDQFCNLVNLDPSVENLCLKAVRMRTTKARVKKVPSVKPSKSTHNPPDLMEFLPSDLQKESPDFSFPGVRKICTGLQGAPQEIAFDLYRHNRMWQGISDY